MRSFILLATAFSATVLATAAPAITKHAEPPCENISPKVIIVTHYNDERNIFTGNSAGEGSFGNLLAQKIAVKGLFSQFPDMHCNSDCEVCLFVTGQGMSQAAASTMAVAFDDQFNLSKTYFVAIGVAGGNPKRCTIGDFTLARFTVQATLQYELGGVDIPTDFETGYFHQGSQSPNDTIGYLYDSEVYEVNAELRDAVAAFIDDSVLVDTPDAQAYRKHYGKDPDFQIGASKPGVRKCDGISSDTWFSGKVIADSLDDRASAWTDGQSRYCCTAQEDGATATALLRAHVAGKVDYSRLILARTITDFDRPYPGQEAIDNLINDGGVGYAPGVINMFMGGNALIMGILKNWDRIYEKGIKPKGYVGDAWAVAGGEADFLLGRVTSGRPVSIPEPPGPPVTLSQKRSAGRHRKKGKLQP